MTFENILIYDDEIKAYYLRVDDYAINKVVRAALGDVDECVSTISEHCEKSIAYWCDLIKAEVDYNHLKERASIYYDEDGYGNFDVTHHISRGGKLVLHNLMNDKEYDLTRENLTDGIDQAITNYISERYDNDFTKLRKAGLVKYNRSLKIYELGDIDSYFADEAIQFALFDDLYYDHTCLRMHGMIRIYIKEYQPLPG